MGSLGYVGFSEGPAQAFTVSINPQLSEKVDMLLAARDACLGPDASTMTVMAEDNRKKGSL